MDRMRDVLMNTTTTTTTTNENDMSIRCKFKVQSITRFNQSGAKRGPNGSPLKDEHGNYIYEPIAMASVKLHPVSGNSDPNHENSKFWSASPSGSFELNTVNLAAVEQLEIDGEYYVDITPAQK